MEFRLLGPLEVWRAGHAIDVRGSKRRTVLALLALHANEVVGRDRLIEELWGERPPANAAAALQNHVSRLRKDLGSEVVVTKPWGYVLRSEPHEIDLKRFESMLVEAKPLPARERREKLGEALALWRGPAFADLVQEPALGLESARLEEIRLAALEQRIDADLELGAHEELVPELEALIGEHPLRERLRGQLILALYRSGRQAEALETYRETRRVLVEELGIEPSADLRELERAILRQDPALAAAQVPVVNAAEAPEPAGWRWPRSPLALGIAALVLGAAGTAAGLLWSGGSAQPSLAAGSNGLADWHEVFRQSTQETVTTVTQVTVEHGHTGTTTIVSRGRGGNGKHGGSGGGTGGTTGGTTVVGKTVSNHPPPPPQPPPPPPVAPPPPPPRPLLVDNFGDGVIDPRSWDVVRDGPGADVDEREGGLEIAFSAKTPLVTPGPFTAGVSTLCHFVGDFEVVADYRLLDWPAEDGVIATLKATFQDQETNTMSIGRASLAGQDGEGYAAFAPPGWSQRRATTDQRGSLRITRVGESLTTYYRDGRSWRRLMSFKRSLGAPGGIGPATFSLQLFSPREAFGWQPARIALDNFFVAAQARRCS
jgi:DNA-binding SARP family transcriptional activator